MKDRDWHLENEPHKLSEPHNLWRHSNPLLNVARYMRASVRAKIEPVTYWGETNHFKTVKKNDIVG